MTPLRNILPSLRSCFVYMIGDEGAVLIYMENGGVVRRLFAPGNAPEQMISFLELFRAHPRTPVYVLVDMMDQSYVRHALPPVTSFGLSKLVKRRLDRDFSKDDIKGALNLGRETEGRKDWNFLLISLSHSDTLKGWLNPIYELPNRFRGIYLVPIECETLIRNLDAALCHTHKTILPGHSLSQAPRDAESAKGEAAGQEKPKKKRSPLFGALMRSRNKGDAADVMETKEEKSQWQMLVCHNKVGGFRQVVLRNGRLIFTRLTQTVNESQPEVLAGNVEQEILNTIEYLKRLSYNPKTGLDVYIIVDQEIKNSISTLRFGATNAHVLTPFETAELLQLKQAVLSSDRFGDVVLAASFGMTGNHRLKMNSAYTAHLDTLEAAKFAVRGGAAVVLLSLLAYAAFGFYTMRSLMGQNDDQQQEQRRTEQALAELHEASARLPADVDEVVDMLFFHEMLTETPYGLLNAVKDLSGILDDDSLVTSLSWKATNAVNPSRDPKNGQKLQVSLTVEMVYKEENWEAFQEKFDAFIKRFQETFPDYEITHGDLPGTFGTKDELKVNFEDLHAQRAGPPIGEKFSITITVSGPTDNPHPDAGQQATGQG